MSSKVYENFLSDLVKEINEKAMDESIWENSDFSRGYQAGMMAIMKIVQDELSAFGLSNKLDLIDVDEWFKLGRDYDFNSP